MYTVCSYGNHIGTWSKLLKIDPSFWCCISCLWVGTANCFVYKLCTSKTRSAYTLKPKGGERLIFSYLKFKPNPVLPYGCFRRHHVRGFLRDDMRQYIIVAVESQRGSFLVTWFNSHWAKDSGFLRIRSGCQGLGLSCGNPVQSRENENLTRRNSFWCCGWVRCVAKGLYTCKRKI